jgi:hypothetical protein
MSSQQLLGLKHLANSSLLCAISCALLCGFWLGGIARAESQTSTNDEQILKHAGIAADDASLLGFFRQRNANEGEIKGLIKKLGDDDFQTREKATQDLKNLGSIAEPYLREALQSGDAEVLRRAEECLKNIGTGPSQGLIAAAARTLARRKPAGAAEVLLAFLPKMEGESSEEEVRAALAALALRNSQPEPVLVAALGEKSGSKRAAAAVALARAGIKELLPAVRKLLQDPEPKVRFEVGLALANLKEKEAVPVLIDLLPALSRGQVGLVEDLLFRLAEDTAPPSIPGTDEESRRKYRDAWAKWWRDQGDKIDLKRLDLAAQFQGYTTIVLLDAGRIADYDKDNKLRWQIEGLNFPLDAQYLPGDRILVAEYQGNQVTERNRKGEILWKKELGDWKRDLDGPLMAQRLPNGNTLIATRFQLLEVDRNGKQVFTLMAPQDKTFMKAQKQPNGDIGLILQTSTTPLKTLFARLDSNGKELSSFPVEVKTSGGRIDLLPNGRVLVPLKDDNKVVEYDSQGKIVWQITFPDPVAAVRLANGHTLITAFKSQRAVEVDATGKEVWEFKADVRLTRAFRR